MDTPSSVDGFSRYFAQAFNENDIIMPTTGFLSLFSRRRPNIQTDASVVDIDIVRGNEKVSAFVPRGAVGQYLSNPSVGTGKYTNKSRTFPLAEDTAAITVAQAQERMAGENPYSSRMLRERTRDDAVRKYTLMVSRMVRSWELAAAKAALTGTQPTILTGGTFTTDTDMIIDYKRDSNLIKTYLTAEQWTTSGVDPIADIDARIDSLVKIGKVGGQAGGEYIIVMGSDVVAGFFANASVISAGDSQRIITVEKNPALMPPSQAADMIAGGMVFVAKITTNKGRKVYILVYDAYYDTDSVANNPYMPAKSFLLMPISFRADRYFGPGDTLPVTSIDRTWMAETFGITNNSPFPAAQIKAAAGVVDPAFFYVDAYPSEGRKSAILRVQSAPIFATTQTDALFTGNSVVA